MVLSACLLVYNHAHLLHEVIQDILDQSYSNFRLIISDDCSTDDSYEIAKSFENSDNRINVIRTPINLGMPGNANYALSKIKNEYVALLHHDDKLDKDTFKFWMECIESKESIAFVFNDYKTERLPSTNYYLKNRLKQINQGNFFLKRILLNQWGCPVRGTALIRKKYYDEVGGMNEKFGLLADVDLWMRLSSRWNVGYVNRPLIKVLQQRPDNYPKDYSGFSWQRLFILYDIHSNNINRQNYTFYIHYIVKRFVFRAKVNIEITKWLFYALIKVKKNIIKESEFMINKYEYFIVKIFRTFLIKVCCG